MWWDYLKSYKISLALDSYSKWFKGSVINFGPILIGLLGTFEEMDFRITRTRRLEF